MRLEPLIGKNHFALLSRESLLLINNVILVVAMLTVLLGTLYPLLVEAISHEKISVGFPYFNGVFIPLMIPLLMLMGFAPYCRWQTTEWSDLCKRLGIIFALSIILALSLPWFFAGKLKVSVVIGLGLALWILLASMQHFFLNKCHFGMLLAHSGVAIVLIGICLSIVYSLQQEVRIHVGDTLPVGNYQFYFLGTQQIQGANYQATRADVLVTKNAKTLGHLWPEKRIYSVQNMALAKTAIQAGLFTDLYVALGESLPGKRAWSMRVYIKPFVRWIWMGGLLMVLGGLLSFVLSLPFLRK